jgi:chemotaxis protein MotA
MDLLAVIGLVLGIGAVLGTQLIEGGHPAVLAQAPAAMIVLVGTLGATLLSSSARELQAARREVARAFRVPRDVRAMLPARYRDLAFIARKDGLISLDMAKNALPTPFMQRAVRHVIDGCESHELRDILASDLRARCDLTLSGARVFEVAGGYAPTMGILGAVLGLVHAMESLSDPSALGAGIAIAFIATIYGVGLANLVLLPVAARIRLRAERQSAEDEMIIEGTLALQSGMSPRTLERVLLAHLGEEVA